MAHLVSSKEPKNNQDTTPRVEEYELDESKGCDHYFELESSDSVLCTKCYIGFYIGKDDRVKDGHLYHHDDLII